MVSVVKQKEVIMKVELDASETNIASVIKQNKVIINESGGINVDVQVREKRTRVNQ